MDVYFAEVLESGRVYVVRTDKTVIYTGNKSRGDVLLVTKKQKHDDDSETSRLVVRVAHLEHDCAGTFGFALERDFVEWLKS